MTAQATDLFRAGDLTGAIAALNEAVRTRPTDQDARALLAELLFFTGAFDRADVQLNAISNMAPDKAVGIALWRQLLRGATAREQLFAEGRLPEFIDPPGPHVQQVLRAMVEAREGDADQAAQLMEAAEAARPPVSGRVDGQGFADMRDLDDLFAPVIEVFTSTGKYFWVPTDSIESIAFDAPERPSDLLWRRASISVRGGTEGVVYIPAIYPALPGDETREDGLLLGRATDWQEQPGGAVRGRGQRCLLFDEADMPILSITEISFSGPQ